jgi:23S rRNA (cytosine1962-C5)-methyltransferase
MSIPNIRLRTKHDRRIRSGHPWVFSNEIDGDIGDLPPGGTVDVSNAKGAFLGRGYANPKSLIAIRILSRRREDVDHPAFWTQKIRSAVRYRAAALPDRTSMRLIHAEGDGLPGLVVDRYGDCLAVQLTTLGMECRKSLIADALREVIDPAGAVLRSEGRSRQLEGLEDERAAWFGEPPDHVDIDEYGVAFRVPLLGGQKTGHFFDQAQNRHFAGPLCRGRTVLDVYANSGAWALHALANGAEHATTIDKSETCCDRTEVNGTLNGVAERMEIIQGEGKRTLQWLVQQQRQFGAVVLDPPAFAKTRKAVGSALRGYGEINALGLSLVEQGGFFFTSSCSYHIEEARFLDEIVKAASRAQRRLRIVRRGEQASDHPVNPNVPESRYLKSYAFEVELQA